MLYHQGMDARVAYVPDVQTGNKGIAPQPLEWLVMVVMVCEKYNQEF